MACKTQTASGGFYNATVVNNSGHDGQFGYTNGDLDGTWETYVKDGTGIYPYAPTPSLKNGETTCVPSAQLHQQYAITDPDNKTLYGTSASIAHTPSCSAPTTGGCIPTLTIGPYPPNPPKTYNWPLIIGVAVGVLLLLIIIIIIISSGKSKKHDYQMY